MDSSETLSDSDTEGKALREVHSIGVQVEDDRRYLFSPLLNFFSFQFSNFYSSKSKSHTDTTDTHSGVYICYIYICKVQSLC